MLINIIHKGSRPDSNSTTYPVRASLSDVLFSFVLEKCIVCDVCGLGFPSFGSSGVMYVSPTDTSSMQDLISRGLRRGLQGLCSWYNGNTWHIGSGCILRPPRCLLLFVGQFRYIDNNVTKDGCSMPMGAVVGLGPIWFGLRATGDHRGPSVHSGHCAASVDCCEGAFYYGSHTVARFRVVDSRGSSAAYVVLCELIDTWFLDLGGGGGGLVAPVALACPLRPVDGGSRDGRWGLWVGWCVSSWWPLFPSRGSVLIDLYMLFYMGSVFFGFPIVSCFLMIIV